MRDETGGITIFVLIISVLLLVAGGMAVDFERQELARADLQNALDRGVLAATNNYQQYDSAGVLSVNEQARQVVYEYIASRNVKSYTPNISVNVTETGGGRLITASADHPLDTIFLRMMGLSTLNVAVSSGAIYSAPNLEITLVLDVSGSMGWNSTSAPGIKLDQLKVAAKDFLDIVLTADTSASTLITIVPFSQQVGLPRSMADLYSLNRYHDYSSCFDFGGLDFTTTAMDTRKSFDQAQHFIESGAGSSSVLFGCPRVNNAITPFSNNVTTLKNAIDALSVETYTATYMGMKWGSAMLDPSARPIVASLIANKQLPPEFAGWPHAWNDPSVRKITVLMSDGQNTRLNEVRDSAYALHTVNYWNTNAPRGSDKVATVDNNRTVNVGGQNLGQGDALLTTICSQSKTGSNSIVYTIGFELAGEPLATAALKDCASSASTFYLVDGVDLGTAFRDIADAIVNLKLTN
jgi:Flp pilus assembly protein TadG